MFWICCSCGDEFVGSDFDDVDVVVYEYCFFEGVV